MLSSQNSQDLGNGKSKAKADLRTNLSSAGEMFIDFSGVQLCQTNSDFYDDYVYAAGDAFEVHQNGKELVVNGEAFIVGMRQILRQRTEWVELPIEKLKNLLLPAYLSAGVPELEAERKSDFMAEVLHENKLYFVSANSALELVAYHESKRFDTNAIYHEDRNVINKEFYEFTETILSPGADAIEVALLDCINNLSLESYAGAVTLHSIVVLPGNSLRYIRNNIKYFLDDKRRIFSSIPFYIHLVLDLKKLYESLGYLDFHEAVFSWVAAILISDPFFEKDSNLHSIYCAAHAYILPGLPCPLELKNAIRGKMLDLEDKSDFSAIEALIEEFYAGKAPPKISETDFEFGELEFEQNFDFSELSFATDIANAAEYLFFKAK